MALIDKKEEIVEEKVKDNQKEVEEPKTSDIVDIDLSVTDKKRFRINGDNERILEINPSDLNIVSRMEKIYPKLRKLANETVSKLSVEFDKEEDEEKVLSKMSDNLKEVDDKMRELLDEMFDANVSEVCAPSGSMYDPFAGKFRFEHIIDTISGLYENNFKQEFNAMSARVAKHTNKYVKK